MKKLGTNTTLNTAPVGNLPAVIPNRATRRKDAKNSTKAKHLPYAAVLPPDPRFVGQDTVAQMLHNERMKRDLASSARHHWQNQPENLDTRHQAIIDWLFLAMACVAEQGYGEANGPGVDILGEIMQVKAGFDSELVPKKGWRGDNKSVRPNVALGWSFASLALVSKLELSNVSIDDAADAVIDAITGKVGAKRMKRLCDIRNRSSSSQVEEASGSEATNIAAKKDEMRNRLVNYHDKLVRGESLIPSDIDAGALDCKIFRGGIYEIDEARRKSQLDGFFNQMINRACIQFSRLPVKT